MQTESTFAAIIKSPVTWTIIFGLVILVIKFLDPAVISDHTAEFLTGATLFIAGILHIPVQVTANAAKRRAKYEDKYIA